MNTAELASALIARLPPHKGGFTFTHNECHGNYETVEYFLKTLGEIRSSGPGFDTEEQKARAIETNDIWMLRWYPDTPIGFVEIAAPTLAELLEVLEKARDL